MPNLLKKLLNQDVWSSEKAMTLVELGADPNTQNDKGQPLIHLLVNKRSFYQIRNLVQKYNVDINSTNKGGLTPLQMLTSNPILHTGNALQLVGLGANPYLPNIAGNPLLHALVCYDHYQIKSHNIDAIKDLVSVYNVDINCKNDKGQTPLQLLINQNKWYTDQALTLVRLGAHPNTTDLNGESLLHLLVNYDKNGIKSHNRSAIITLVSILKADINATNKKGETALQSLMNNPKGFKARDALLLVSLGADKNTQNAKGETLLHLLATRKEDNSAAIDILIKKYHASVDLMDNNKQTALDIALNSMSDKKNTANANELMKTSIQFNRAVNQIFNNPKLTKEDGLSNLNTLISQVHLVEDDKSYALQGKIRMSAFDSFKEMIRPLNPAEQIEKLEWAKTQPVFSMHRSHCFLARIGRTNTVIMIDKMIADIKTSNPELDSKIVNP